MDMYFNEKIKPQLQDKKKKKYSHFANYYFPFSFMLSSNHEESDEVTSPGLD